MDDLINELDGLVSDRIYEIDDLNLQVLEIEDDGISADQVVSMIVSDMIGELNDVAPRIIEIIEQMIYLSSDQDEDILVPLRSKAIMRVNGLKAYISQLTSLSSRRDIDTRQKGNDLSILYNEILGLSLDYYKEILVSLDAIYRISEEQDQDSCCNSILGRLDQIDSRLDRLEVLLRDQF